MKKLVVLIVLLQIKSLLTLSPKLPIVTIFKIYESYIFINLALNKCNLIPWTWDIVNIMSSLKDAQTEGKEKKEKNAGTQDNYNVNRVD